MMVNFILSISTCLITSEMLRQGTLDKIDYAIVEAVSISEDGMIIPSTSIGNSAIFVEYADNVLSN